MSDRFNTVTELDRAPKSGLDPVIPGRVGGMSGSEPDPALLTPVEARQGVVSGRVFLVLLTSVVLAVIALGLVYLLSR